jgi:hypothetical protein
MLNRAANTIMAKHNARIGSMFNQHRRTLMRAGTLLLALLLLAASGWAQDFVNSGTLTNYGTLKIKANLVNTATGVINNTSTGKIRFTSNTGQFRNAQPDITKITNNGWFIFEGTDNLFTDGTGNPTVRLPWEWHATSACRGTCAIPRAQVPRMCRRATTRTWRWTDLLRRRFRMLSTFRGHTTLPLPVATEPTRAPSTTMARITRPSLPRPSRVVRSTATTIWRLGPARAPAPTPQAPAPRRLQTTRPSHS